MKNHSRRIHVYGAQHVALKPLLSVCRFVVLGVRVQYTVYSIQYIILQNTCTTVPATLRLRNRLMVGVSGGMAGCMFRVHEVAPRRS